MNTTSIQPGVSEHLDKGSIGRSGRTIVVTKEGEVGGIEIDDFSGEVINPNEAPEWASGLTNALLAERHIFYASRLGGLYTDELKSPDTLAYGDLSWVHAQYYEEPLLVQEEVRDPETGEVTQMAQYDHVELSEVSADHEFRMGRIAEITGIAGDIDLVEGTFGKDALSATIAQDNERSAEELAAFDKAKAEGFSGKIASGS